MKDIQIIQPKMKNMLEAHSNEKRQQCSQGLKKYRTRFCDPKKEQCEG